MKEIILVRHGKSSWDYHGVSDKDRPLSERGIRDAALVAKYLAKRIEEPELIYSSTANRALHTAVIFMNGLDIDSSRIAITDQLYSFSAETVMEFIRNLDESYKNVMIFGHNPGFTSISNIFGDKPIDNLPTAGVVKIRFEVSAWQQVKKGLTEIVVFPKLLY